MTESCRTAVLQKKKSDKKSRNCFACAAQAECNWDRQKMNLEIDY